MDDYLIYYVPSTAQKRIQRLGGKEDKLSDSSSNQMGANLLNLNIHLLANMDEFISLVVSSTLTLDKILKYLCNKPYWETEDSQKKKGFFGSFGRAGAHSPSALKNKPKFISRTKDFHDGLTNLVSLITGGKQPDREKPLTSAELSLISFAKKSVNQYDSTSAFVPLTVSTHTTVAQCFTQQELKQTSADNPLTLYLYLSSTGNSELGSSNGLQKEEFANKTIFLTKDMLTYLTSLVLRESPEDRVEQTKKTILEMVDTLFSSLLDIVPYTERALPLTSLEKNPKATAHPLVSKKFLHFENFLLLEIFLLLIFIICFYLLIYLVYHMFLFDDGVPMGTDFGRISGSSSISSRHVGLSLCGEY